MTAPWLRLSAESQWRLRHELERLLREPGPDRAAFVAWAEAVLHEREATTARLRAELRGRAAA